MHSDRLLGLVTLALGTGVFVAGLDIIIPPGTEDSLSPRFFPLLLSCVLILLGALLTFTGGGVPLSTVRERVFSRTSLSLLCLTAVYTLSFGYMDYRIGTLLFMGIGMGLLGTCKKWELVVIPVVVTAVMYAVFRYGFLVLLPTWG